MSCSNCFNGCADIVSDQCVKYTGVDIPELEIVKGDSLLVVENQIINKILEIISGEGILPSYTSEGTCDYVTDFLPSSGDITLNDVLKAYMDSICGLNTNLTNLTSIVNSLNSPYDIGCLSGSIDNSDTHAVLQELIDKFCIVSGNLTTLTTDVETNYVLISEINSYIQAYLDSVPSSSLYNSRMVPYVAVPYFGGTAGIFDITGAGTGDWIKIYLCNGQNLTPDLRGRTLVGTTTMGNTAFNPAVDPGIAGNPTYNLGDTTGSNLAYLTNPAQLPPHAHSATVNIIDPMHSHPSSTQDPVDGSGSVYVYDSVGDKEHYGLKSTNLAATGITATATVGSTGASEGHNNIQPVLAANFIIYIP